MVIHNMDILGLCKRIRRMKFEACKCVSASLMHTTDADRTRILTYLDSLNQYFTFMIGQEMMDLPESHPTDYELGEIEKLPIPENEALSDLINQFDALEMEMALSQSARMHTSMMAHDEKRFRDIVQKITNFVTDYIANVQPLDMPESTPSREMTGHGKRIAK